MPRKREGKLPRGIHEKPPGSGCYWIQYIDASGHRRREKAGTLGMAKSLLAKRRNEKLLGIKLPENLRTRPVSFGELIDDALEYSKAHKSSHKQDEYRMAPVREEFGTRPADKITPQDIDRWLADEADENDWQPGTVNRFKALFSLIFRLGIENGKIKENPARLVKRRREDNGRVRF